MVPVLPTLAGCCVRVRVKWRQECAVDKFLRAAWRLLFAGRVDAERLVFVDEMGTNTSLTLIYGWACRGQRVYFRVPTAPANAAHQAVNRTNCRPPHAPMAP